MCSRWAVNYRKTYFLPLPSFDDCVESMRNWLQQMDVSLKAEPALGAESQQGATDAAEELEKIENLHKELLERRYVQVSHCDYLLKIP